MILGNVAIDGRSTPATARDRRAYEALGARGLLAPKGPGRPGEYGITDAGRAALAEWVAARDAARKGR